MNKKKIISLFTLAAAVATLPACNDFLEEMPDNRTELDTGDKIVNVLVSAYSEYPYTIISEFASDNVDEIVLENPQFDPEQEEYYRWQDVTSSTYNEAPQAVWTGLYKAVGTANHALEAIEKLGGATTDQLKAAKGEALLCRAYGHFLLVNLFCQAYNPAYADTDMGIPYITKPETSLDPKYDRGTVAGVYERIYDDLQDGLPLINDSYYKQPKYHFNRQAAYAFAARFYLFYQKWDECIAAANEVFNNGSPATMMRDLAANGKMNMQSADGQTLLRTMDYINSAHSCNLLLQPGITQVPGLCFGPYEAVTGFTHGNLLNSTETFEAQTAPWATKGDYKLYSAPFTMQDASADKSFAWRCPYLFEIKDPVMQTGLPRYVYPAFTVEETLLCRAEAYIMKKEYTPALEDMNLWISKYVKPDASKVQQLTTANVDRWAKNTDFYTYDNPTVKKKIEAPAFPVESGTQENMCYALLHLRRVETAFLGLRWFDVKRYGITIYRRKVANATDVTGFTDILVARDPRSAMQIPPDVVAAGLEANPR